MKHLGTLPGGSYSEGHKINSSGQIAGSSWIFPDSGNPTIHTFLYNHGVMKDLGTVGGSQSIPSAINATGQITGESLNAGDTANHAFISNGGTMADLNDLIPSEPGWELNWGVAINDNGQIVGYGVVNGQTHAFLLTPRKTTVGQPIQPGASRVFNASKRVATPSMTPPCVLAFPLAASPARTFAPAARFN
jgi:probable HAF family extracellular repeat protein